MRAAEILVRRHATQALDLLQNSDLMGMAEDALQEAWLKVLTSPCGFSGGSFSIWLAFIARRDLLQMQKSFSREVVNLRWRSATRASRRIYFDQIVAAIESLPNPEHRRAATMHWIEELSTYEIGRRLETPAKTIQSRIKVAREQLMVLLSSPTSHSTA